MAAREGLTVSFDKGEKTQADSSLTICSWGSARRDAASPGSDAKGSWLGLGFGLGFGLVLGLGLGLGLRTCTTPTHSLLVLYLPEGIRWLRTHLQGPVSVLQRRCGPSGA